MKPTPELNGSQTGYWQRACNSLKLLRSRSSAALCSPHSFQLVLNRAFDLRELLYIADAQHHIRVGPVLWIEE
jgi:hypothetical protein